MKLKEPQVVVNYFGVYLLLPRELQGGYLAMDTGGCVYFYFEEPRFRKIYEEGGVWDDASKDELPFIFVCKLEGNDLKPKDSLHYIE